MFYLEHINNGKWVRKIDKGFKSSEYVKDAFKILYGTSAIARPVPGSYRIVDDNGMVVFIYDYMQSNGRLMWKWAK